MLTQRIEVEKEQSNRFLYQMLPQYVAQQLKLGITGITEKYAGVTILYSDIKGIQVSCVEKT